MSNKKNLLGFKKDKEDIFYNRRRLAVMCVLYSIFWGFTVLITDIIFNIESAKVIAYLGFVSTVGGLPIWQYLKAAAKEKEENKE